MKNKNWVFSALFFLLLSTNIACNIGGCSSNNESTAKNKYKKLGSLFLTKPISVDEQKEQLKGELKDLLLPEFTNTRKIDAVISERELVQSIIDTVFERPIDLHEKMENPFWEDASFGGLVLIEDYIGMSAGNPYYYLITFVEPAGYIIGEYYAYAMANSKFAGHYGMSVQTNTETIPTKRRSLSEAQQVVTNKFSLSNNDIIDSKAVCIATDPATSYFEWGWAFKLKSPVVITSINGKEYSSNIVYVSSMEFNLSWLAVQTSSIKSEIVDYYKKKINISLVDKNIFDSLVLINCSKINKNTPKTEKELYIPRLIPVEYQM